MKTKLTLLLLIPLFSFAQMQFDDATGKISFEKIHEVDLSKEDIKSKTIEWLSRTYENSNYTVKLNEDDKILSKGNFKNTFVTGDFYGAPLHSNEYIDFTLAIYFKDGRYKINFDDVQLNGYMNLDYGNLDSEQAFEEYKTTTRKQAEEYGFDLVLKRLDNDKKARKDFERWKPIYLAQKEKEKEEIKQLFEKIEALDNSLNKFIIEDKEEDW